MMFYKACFMLIGFLWPCVSMATFLPSVDPVECIAECSSMEDVHTLGIRLYNKGDKVQAHACFNQIIEAWMFKTEEKALNHDQKSLLSKALHNYGRTSFDLGKINLAALVFEIAAEEYQVKESKTSLKYIKAEKLLDKIPSLKITEFKNPVHEDKDIPLLDFERIYKRIIQCKTKQQQYDLGIFWRNQGDALSSEEMINARLFWCAANITLGSIKFEKSLEELRLNGTQEEKDFFIRVTHNRGMLFYKIRKYQEAAREFTLAHDMGSKTSWNNIQKMIKDGLIKGKVTRETTFKTVQSSSKKIELTAQEHYDLGIKFQQKSDLENSNKHFRRVIVMLSSSRRTLSTSEKTLLDQTFYHSGLNDYKSGNHFEAILAFERIAPRLHAAEDKLLEIRKTGELQRIIDQETSKVNKKQLENINARLDCKRILDELEKEIFGLNTLNFSNFDFNLENLDRNTCLDEMDVSISKFQAVHLAEMQRVAQEIYRYAQPTDLLVAIGRSPLYYTRMLQALHPEIKVLEMPFSIPKKNALALNVNDHFKEKYKSFMTNKGLGPAFFDPTHAYKNIILIDYVYTGKTLSIFQELLMKNDPRFEKEGCVKILALTRKEDPLVKRIFLNHSIVVDEKVGSITFDLKYEEYVSYGVGLPFNPEDWCKWKDIDFKKLSPVAKARLNQITEWAHTHR